MSALGTAVLSCDCICIRPAACTTLSARNESTRDGWVSGGHWAVGVSRPDTSRRWGGRIAHSRLQAVVAAPRLRQSRAAGWPGEAEALCICGHGRVKGRHAWSPSASRRVPHLAPGCQPGLQSLSVTQTRAAERRPSRALAWLRAVTCMPPGLLPRPSNITCRRAPPAGPCGEMETSGVAAEPTSTVYIYCSDARCGFDAVVLGGRWATEQTRWAS